jgi:hypothetical protein
MSVMSLSYKRRPECHEHVGSKRKANRVSLAGHEDAAVRGGAAGTDDRGRAAGHHRRQPLAAGAAAAAAPLPRRARAGTSVSVRVHLVAQRSQEQLSLVIYCACGVVYTIF